MAENINFIPANELPVAEGDEVSVLCLEGGELKQKPGASLGGSKPTLTVRVLYQYDEDTDSTTLEAELVSGSFDAAMQTLNNDEPVLMRIIEDGSNLPLLNGDSRHKSVSDWAMQYRAYSIPGGTLERFSTFGIATEIVLFSDGTLEVYEA